MERTSAGTAAQSGSMSSGVDRGHRADHPGEQLGTGRTLHSPAHPAVEDDEVHARSPALVARAPSSRADSNAVPMRGSFAMRAAEVRPPSMMITTRRSRPGRQVRTTSLVPDGLTGS